MPNFTEKSDNTRVDRPQYFKPIQYKLKLGEFFFTDRNGKKQVVRNKNAQFNPDNRTFYQKKLDVKQSLLRRLQLQDEQNKLTASRTVGAIAKLVSPSTYIGPIFNSNGKSYTENVMSGEGSGNAITDFILDMVAPGTILGKVKTSSNPRIFNSIKKITDPILLNDSRQLSGSELLVLPRKRAVKEVSQGLSNPKLYIDNLFGDYNGIITSAELTPYAENYSEVVMSKLHNYGVNPKIDFSKNLYDWRPVELGVYSLPDLKFKGWYYNDDIGGFYHTLDDKVYVRRFSQLDHPNVQMKIDQDYPSNQLHEAVSHRTDKYVPLEVAKQYLEIDPYLDWREIRATSNEVDAKMRQKYGENYGSKIIPGNAEFDPDIYKDYFYILDKTNGYGLNLIEKWINLELLNEYLVKFAKTLSLPGFSGLLFNLYGKDSNKGRVQEKVQ